MNRLPIEIKTLIQDIDSDAIKLRNFGNTDFAPYAKIISGLDTSVVDELCTALFKRFACYKYKIINTHTVQISEKSICDGRDADVAEFIDDNPGYPVKYILGHDGHRYPTVERIFEQTGFGFNAEIVSQLLGFISKPAQNNICIEIVSDHINIASYKIHKSFDTIFKNITDKSFFTSVLFDFEKYQASAFFKNSDQTRCVIRYAIRSLFPADVANALGQFLKSPYDIIDVFKNIGYPKKKLLSILNSKHGLTFANQLFENRNEFLDLNKSEHAKKSIEQGISSKNWHNRMQQKRANSNQDVNKIINSDEIYKSVKWHHGMIVSYKKDYTYNLSLIYTPSYSDWSKLDLLTDLNTPVEFEKQDIFYIAISSDHEKYDFHRFLTSEGKNFQTLIKHTNKNGNIKESTVSKLVKQAKISLTKQSIK